MWGKSSKKKRKLKNQQDKKQKAKAIAAFNRANKLLSDCWFCFDNPNLDRSLILSIGNFSYLALPKRGSLTPDHCLIIPMEHITSLNAADEGVSEEISVILFNYN